MGPNQPTPSPMPDETPPVTPSPEIEPPSGPEELPQTDPIPVDPGDWRPHD